MTTLHGYDDHVGIYFALLNLTHHNRFTFEEFNSMVIGETKQFLPLDNHAHETFGLDQPKGIEISVKDYAANYKINLRKTGNYTCSINYFLEGPEFTNTPLWISSAHSSSWHTINTNGIVQLDWEDEDHIKWDIFHHNNPDVPDEDDWEDDSDVTNVWMNELNSVIITEEDKNNYRNVNHIPANIIDWPLDSHIGLGSDPIISWDIIESLQNKIIQHTSEEYPDEDD